MVYDSVPVDTTVVVKRATMSWFHKRQINSEKEFEAATGYDGDLSRSL